MERDIGQRSDRRKGMISISRYKYLGVISILLAIGLGIMTLTSSCCQSPTGPGSSTGPPIINSNSAEFDEFDNTDLPITPIEELHITGEPIEVDITDYRLTVDGLVKTPLTLTYAAIKEYPVVIDVVLLVCPGFFADNAQWTGVPVKILLAEAGVKPDAGEVVFSDPQGYRQVLPLDVVQQEGVFLAYLVDGQVLPVEHGYPVRLVVEGGYGYNWVKWVDHIEVR